MLVAVYKNIFLSLAALFVGLAILAISVFGLRFGIDFTGGSLLEVRYDDRPERAAVEEALSTLPFGEYSLRVSGEDGYLLRTRALSEEERQDALEALTFSSYTPEVERFATIGPTIGAELRTKALVALLIVIVVIVSYVAFAFREVSEPVSSFKYGAMAIVALLHDIIIPVGLFAILGALVGAEIDILFVMALLAILGYSVNDTIVVFDRIRENLKHNSEVGRKEEFAQTVGRSLDQTYARSINTSLTTTFVLLALFFFGGTATQNFALVLFTGVLAGTYSSLFLAPPLLLFLESKKKSI